MNKGEKKTFESLPWVNEAVLVPVKECNVLLQNVLVRCYWILHNCSCRYVHIREANSGIVESGNKPERNISSKVLNKSPPPRSRLKNLSFGSPKPKRSCNYGRINRLSTIVLHATQL